MEVDDEGRARDLEIEDEDVDVDASKIDQFSSFNSCSLYDQVYQKNMTIHNNLHSVFQSYNIFTINQFVT